MFNCLSDVMSKFNVDLVCNLMVCVSFVVKCQFGFDFSMINVMFFDVVVVIVIEKVKFIQQMGQFFFICNSFVDNCNLFVVFIILVFVEDFNGQNFVFFWGFNDVNWFKLFFVGQLLMGQFVQFFFLSGVFCLFCFNIIGNINIQFIILMIGDKGVGDLFLFFFYIVSGNWVFMVNILMVFIFNQGGNNVDMVVNVIVMKLVVFFIVNNWFVLDDVCKYCCV